MILWRECDIVLCPIAHYLKCLVFRLNESNGDFAPIDGRHTLYQGFAGLGDYGITRNGTLLVNTPVGVVTVT